MLVFAYGTLTDPERAAAVVEHAVEGPATLDGLRRVEGRYPTLAPGGSVEGRLLRVADVAALDAYEGVDRGLYVRASVPVAGRDGRAAVYVGDPARLDADADWPGDGPFPERVRRYVREHDVEVRPE